MNTLAINKYGLNKKSIIDNIQSYFITQSFSQKDKGKNIIKFENGNESVILIKAEGYDEIFLEYHIGNNKTVYKFHDNKIYLYDIVTIDYEDISIKSSQLQILHCLLDEIAMMSLKFKKDHFISKSAIELGLNLAA